MTYSFSVAVLVVHAMVAGPPQDGALPCTRAKPSHHKLDKRMSLKALVGPEAMVSGSDPDAWSDSYDCDLTERYVANRSSST